jgi:hypothetical protein
LSLLEVVGDIASLVTERPLAPDVRMPDTVLAWRVNPPPELGAIVSAAREVATTVYADQNDDR